MTIKQIIKVAIATSKLSKDQSLFLLHPVIKANDVCRVNDLHGYWMLHTVDLSRKYVGS